MFRRIADLGERCAALGRGTPFSRNRPRASRAATGCSASRAQVDDESNDSLLATFNWGVTEGTWLSFTAGRSSSPADRANIDADTLVASVDHSFGTVGVALEIERWGDEDALETSDWRGTVYYEPERFRIGVALRASRHRYPVHDRRAARRKVQPHRGAVERQRRDRRARSAGRRLADLLRRDRVRLRPRPRAAAADRAAQSPERLDAHAREQLHRSRENDRLRQRARREAAHGHLHDGPFGDRRLEVRHVRCGAAVPDRPARGSRGEPRPRALRARGRGIYGGVLFLIYAR